MKTLLHRPFEVLRARAEAKPEPPKPVPRNESDGVGLYREAMAADAKFSTELRRAYGKNAGDRRYRESHTDSAVQSAMVEFVNATKALEEWFAKSREERS